MGLLSSIGKIAGGSLGKIVGGAAGGPVGAAIGGALGGAIDGKNASSGDAKARKNQRIRDRKRFAQLRSDALRGGYHPLEVLRAGGSPALSERQPRIATNRALLNSFDELDDIVSGRKAADDKREQLNDELLRAKIDESRRGTFGVPSRSSSTPGAPERADTMSGQERSIRQPNGPGAPMSRPDVWSEGSIMLVGPNGVNHKFPKTYARRLNLKTGDPLMMEDIEAIAGDEVGQMIYADIAANIGLDTRRGSPGMTGFDAKQAVQGKLKSVFDFFDGGEPTGRKPIR